MKILMDNTAAPESSGRWAGLYEQQNDSTITAIYHPCYAENELDLWEAANLISFF